MAFSGGDDATLAFLGVLNAHEVLIDVVGKQPTERHVLASQDTM